VLSFFVLRQPSGCLPFEQPQNASFFLSGSFPTEPEFRVVTSPTHFGWCGPGEVWSQHDEIDVQILDRRSRSCLERLLDLFGACRCSNWGRLCQWRAGELNSEKERKKYLHLFMLGTLFPP
jgi:hypothetical protein